MKERFGNNGNASSASKFDAVQNSPSSGMGERIQQTAVVPPLSGAQLENQIQVPHLQHFSNSQ